MTLASSRPASARAHVDVGALFRAQAPFLLRVVERLTGPGDHVEDVVQEVFLTAHRKRAGLDPESDLRGWLYRVAVNIIRHHRRSFARRRALADQVAAESTTFAAEEGPEARLARQEQAARIRECVQQLPLPQREVFVLFELEGMEGRDVARLCEIPENTVWSRLRKARERFKRTYRARRSSDGTR